MLKLEIPMDFDPDHDPDLDWKKEFDSSTQCDLALLEERRRHIGMAFAMHNLVCNLSKLAISYMKRGNTVALNKCIWAMLLKFNQLYGLSAPKWFLAQRINEAAQEVLETLIMLRFANYVLDLKMDFSKRESIATVINDLRKVIVAHSQVPRTDDDAAMDSEIASVEHEFFFDPAHRLAGTSDAVGEIGKMLLNLLTDDALNKIQDRKALRRRFIDFGNELQEYLSRFETCYGMAIDNTQRRDFFATFRGKMLKLDQLIEREQHAYSLILDQEAVLRLMIETVLPRDRR